LKSSTQVIQRRDRQAEMTSFSALCRLPLLPMKAPRVSTASSCP
jgi:hypothetical protein